MREIVSPLDGFLSPFGARLRAVFVLFIPSGSDSLIDANGDTFKVRE